jgi:hypothetical protein
MNLIKIDQNKIINLDKILYITTKDFPIEYYPRFAILFFTNENEIDCYLKMSFDDKIDRNLMFEEIYNTFKHKELNESK